LGRAVKGMMRGTVVGIEGQGRSDAMKEKGVVWIQSVEMPVLAAAVWKYRYLPAHTPNRRRLMINARMIRWERVWPTVWNWVVRGTSWSSGRVATKGVPLSRNT
jgi:hypothetical protein